MPGTRQKTKTLRTRTRRGDTSQPTAATPENPAGLSGEKYQRILDAAIEVIAENGYFNSPISKIAERADVADGTVYLYFKNKDDVLRTAIDSTYAKFYVQVEEELKRIPGAREQLEMVGRIHIQSHTVTRSMAIVMQTEVRQSAKFIQEFSHKHMARYITMVRDIVRLGQQQGVFRKDLSAGVVAHCWFGAIDELISTSVLTGRDYDAKATTARVMDVLLNGIGT